LKEKSSKKPAAFILILGLNYFPIIFLPIINEVGGNIGGFPIVWVYMIIWVLFSFTLLVIAYFIDKRLGE